MLVKTSTAEQKTLQRLVDLLEIAEIPHAVIGSMATELYGARGWSNDVHVLLSQGGFDQFSRMLARENVDWVPGRRRRFTDRANGVRIELFLAGHHPGRRGPGPIAFPDPTQASEMRGGCRLLPLPRLIELQLAARSHYDSAEVVSLIQTHRLEESFLDQLHPSVHRAFIECLEEKRREDEFEARQNADGDDPPAGM